MEAGSDREADHESINDLVLDHPQTASNLVYDDLNRLLSLL